MALPTYQLGSIPSATEFNAFLRPAFDTDPPNELFPGHLYRLTDDALSNVAGSLKPDFRNFQTGLQVTAGTGLSVAYNSGSVFLQTLGSLASISGSTIALPDNSNTWVYVNTSGTVAISNTQPPTGLILAYVTTQFGSVTGVVDWRSRNLFQVPGLIYNAIKVFGGTNQTDFTATAGQILDYGSYYYRNFTVPAGITLTISRYARIVCSGSANIAGTVNITPFSNGASGFSTALSGTNTVGGYGGSGANGGSGSTASAGTTCGFLAQPYGSGGGLGFCVGSPTSSTSVTGTINIGGAGNGGGGFILEAAGTVSVSGSINANGTNGISSVLTSGTGRSSGSGGGSGGLIYLSSLVSIVPTNSAIFSTIGGNGANAIKNSASGDTLGCAGGSGGGGGWIVFQSPLNIGSSASILLSGGSQGSSAGNLDMGGGGGGGYGGAGGNQSAGSIGRFLSLNYVPVG